MRPIFPSPFTSTYRRFSAAVLLSVCLAGVTAYAALSAESSGESGSLDLLIENGRVVDGSGNPWFHADVGIADGVIVAVGDLKGTSAARHIDAAGLIVAPGFIDIHSHADDHQGRRWGLRSADLARRRAINIVSQGVTTVAVNPDGFGEPGLSIADQRGQLLEPGVGLNVVLMAAHGAIRGFVMGKDHRRAATDDEVSAMQALVGEAMEQGAFGLSTGLEYPPGRYSDLGELVSLMEIVRPYGGVHISHMRSETTAPMWWVPSQHYPSPPQLLDAVAEVVEIAERTATKGVVTHMKVRGTTHWGQSEQVIEFIEAARARGVEMYGDQYPYDTSGSDGELVLIPMWALGLERRPDKDDKVDLREFFLSVLDDADRRDTLLSDIRHSIAFRGGAENIIVFDYPDTSLIGRDLQSLADEQQLTPAEYAIQMQLDGYAGRPGGARLRSFSLAERDMEALMSRPWVATSSDGGVTLAEDGPAVHARYNGAFTRKIARYVTERGTLSLEHAVRAATTLPAQILGLRDRGMIRAGLAADVVVFDADDIRDRSTFTKPHQLSSGVAFVLVNGELVIDNGEPTGLLAGTVLHRATSGPGSQE